jgi:hypothetical protein
MLSSCRAPIAVVSWVFAMIPVDAFVEKIESEDQSEPHRIMALEMFATGLDEFQVYEAGALRSTTAFEAVIRVASSSNLKPNVTKAARRALGQVDDERAVEGLISIVKSDSASALFKTEAIQSLGKQAHAGSKPALKVLAEISVDSSLDKGLKASAGIAMGRLRPRDPDAKSQTKPATKVKIAGEEVQLSEEDLAILKDYQAGRVSALESAIASDQGVLERSRKNNGKSGFPTNAYFQPAVVQQRIKRARLQIAAEQKQDVFERAVLDLAFFCDVLGKTREFTSLASKSRDLKKTAAELPVVTSRKSTLKSIQGEVTESVEKFEHRIDSWHNDPDHSELHARITNHAEHPRLRDIDDTLRSLSFDGLCLVKAAYLERLKSSRR